jgi:hypothetical protein
MYGLFSSEERVEVVHFGETLSHALEVSSNPPAGVFQGSGRFLVRTPKQVVAGVALL